MQETVNQELCPFCIGVNTCMVNNNNPCWCNNITIPSELAALVPAHLKDKSCICLTCVNLFKENPEHFKQSIKTVLK